MSFTIALTLFTQLAHANAVKVQNYAISGSTGIELYTSIGERGPKDGGGAIASTAFKLTWKRLFDERGGDCYLVHAKPQLTITMHLPKPKGQLSASMKRKWDAFLAGVRKHEDVHVVMIREMVEKAETAVQGAVVANDPTCKKVKAEVSRRLDEAAATHKARSRAFDREELSEGGVVHRLVLALVNE